MKLHKRSRFEAFLSLDWYEAFLKFIANFVAKSAELLLAAGLVVSSANFLTDGDVLVMGSAASRAWSWTQALAIDASLGISFYYVLQCLKQRDWVKFSLYSLLTLVLTLVAGIITDGDIFSHAMHTPINQAMTLLGIDVRLLSILRSVAVVGFVLMSRLRDVSFKEFTVPDNAMLSRDPTAIHHQIQQSGQVGSSMEVGVSAEKPEPHFSVEDVARLLQLFRTNEAAKVEDPARPTSLQREQPAAQMISQKRPVPVPPANGTVVLVQESVSTPVSEEPPVREPERHEAVVPMAQRDPLEHELQFQVSPREPGFTGGARSQVHAPVRENIPLEREERLEQAYQELLAEGQKISGRTLAERAHIHRATCVEWLRVRQRVQAQVATDIQRIQEPSEPEEFSGESSV
jgi:hypothetical protein